ncbi:hypothetical protein [Mesobacillus zeae]|uniref:hypothetical protein n=1 Tax=Mesobacillus zeae TaxID=1917180 RepID=UPI0015E6823A|nr:hypothetical protein [Mesobacillus zeae]
MSRNTVKEYLEMTPEKFEDFLISLRNRTFRDLIVHWLTEHPDLTGAQVYDWWKD